MPSSHKHNSRCLTRFSGEAESSDYILGYKQVHVCIAQKHTNYITNNA